MGNINLSKFESSKKYEENVISQYRFVCNEDDIKHICTLLEGCDLLKDKRNCYIYGYGSQSKSTYKKLEQNSDGKYDLKWYGYNGPKKFKLLSHITASCSGLLCIKETSCISHIIEILSNLAMVGIFSISKEFSTEFENLILNNKEELKEMPDDFIKKDKSFFYYIIDGDSYHEVEKGYLCQTALGKESTDCLFKIIEFTEKRW